MLFSLSSAVFNNDQDLNIINNSKSSSSDSSSSSSSSSSTSVISNNSTGSVKTIMTLDTTTTTTSSSRTNHNNNNNKQQQKHNNSNNNNSNNNNNNVSSSISFMDELWISTDYIFQNKLTWLLVLGPVAIIGDSMGILGEAACFAFSGIALIPCAERLSFVTEQVAEHTNGTIGALLNATFGNAPELLISVSALRSGFYRIVQLAMLGSMITNMIFVFGAACLLGGLRWQVQELRLTSGNVSAGMLFVSTAGSLIPAILILSGQFPETGTSITDIHSATKNNSGSNESNNQTRRYLLLHEEDDQLFTIQPTQEEITLSRVNAAVMLILYLLYLIFQLGTHKDEFDDEQRSPQIPNVFCHNLYKRIRNTLFTNKSTNLINATTGTIIDMSERSIFNIGSNNTNVVMKKGASDRDIISDKSKVSPNINYLNAASNIYHDDIDLEEQRNQNDSNNINNFDNNMNGNDRTRTSFSDNDGTSTDEDTEIQNLIQRNNNSPTAMLANGSPRSLSPKERRLVNRKTMSLLVRSRSEHTYYNSRHDSNNNPNNNNNSNTNSPFRIEPPDILSISQDINDWPKPNLFQKDDHDNRHGEGDGPVLSMRIGILWLFIITLCISAMSDILVATIDGFAQRMQLSQVFTSMVIIPFFSNVAEQVSAFLFAWRNEMDLCVGVTIGSAIQIATFVLPGSVLIGYILNRSMTLYFHPYETACLFFCTVVVSAVLHGGTTNWFVGAMLVGIYTIYAAGIWFHETENLSIDAEEFIHT